MLRSLRSRLTLTHSLVALFAVLIVAVITTTLIQRGFEKLAERQEQLDADNAVALLNQFYERRQSWKGIGAWLRRTFEQSGATQPRRRRLQLFDPQGTLLFDSLGTRPRQQRPLPDGVQRPIMVDGRNVGTVVLGEAGNRFT